MIFSRLLLVVALLMTICSSVWATPLIVKPAKVTVAVGDNIYPYQFIDENNKLSGYVVDFWRLWQSKSGIEVEFVPSGWSDTIENVKSGVADIHGALAITNDRRKELSFSGDIYKSTLSVYIHRDVVGVSTIQDVSPYIVGLLRDSVFESVIRRQNPNIRFRIYDSREDMLVGIDAGEVKAFVTFDYYAFSDTGYRALTQTFPAYKRVPAGIVSASYAVRKVNEYLIPFVDSGIAQISSQERGALDQKWFGTTNVNAALRLSFTIGNEPYMAMSPNGEATGLFVDLWRKWAEKTKTEVEFMPNSMALSLQALQEGKSNVHIGYPESQIVNTGLPRAVHLYSVFSNLFVNEFYDTDGDLSQLNGKNVGLFTSAPYKQEFQQRFPKINVVWLESLDDGISKAINNEIIGFVSANQVARLRLVQHNVENKFNVIKEIKYEAKIYSIVNDENRALIQKIQAGFDLISLDEKIAIENRWVKDEADQYFKSRKYQVQLTDDEKHWVKMVPELSVGVVKDWFPYEFIDEDGNLQGISIDIFRIATELTGQAYNFEIYDSWNELMTAFKSGEIDIVANITESEDRQELADFTSSYWHTPWSITTHKSQENVDSIENFFGKRIALINGYQMIQDLNEQYPQVIIQVVETFEEALTLLKAGIIDGVLDNMLVSAGFLKENNLYQFKIHVIEDLPYDMSHIGVRKDLKQQYRLMEKVVGSISEEDREEIITRWSKIDVVQGINSKIYLRNIIAFIFIATVVIASVLFWNRRLKNEINLRIAAESKLKHMASHDLMTGLPNRALFNDRLNQAIVSHGRNKRSLAVMFIDLDGFKQVNDTFGHDVGDELLMLVANRLRDVCRKSDTVARIGGDEFVILVTDLYDQNQASKVAEKIIADFIEPFDLSVSTINVGASIGISCFPEHGESASELLKAADDAMYSVKETGKNSYQFTIG